MAKWRRIVGALALAALGAISASALTFEALASAVRQPTGSAAPARAQVIRAELNARYRLLPGRRLVVTEASSTSVVESLTLLSGNLQESRTIAAHDGVWYAICPVRATCPYPTRGDGRPAGAYLPRQLALELALRTFLETSASVVAVSLPTPRLFTVFVMERSELARDTDLPSLLRSLRRDRANASKTWRRTSVDYVTRSHVFVFVGLEPTPSGGESFGAIPQWPEPSTG